MSRKIPQFARPLHGLLPVSLGARPKKKLVMIALPVEGFGITTAIGRLQADAAILSLNPSYPFGFHVQVVHDRYPTEYARNTLCKHFLASKADLLWFVDSDTLPSENSFDLLKVDADVVAGIYPIYRGERSSDQMSLDWSMYDQTEFGDSPRWKPICLEEQPPGAIISCDAAATGCMVIKRHVIEHYAKGAFVDKKGVPAIFFWPKLPSGESVASDDLDFCRRLKEDGFSLKVHTGVRWGHLKQRNLSEVYDKFKEAFFSGIREQALLDAGEHPGAKVADAV